MKKITVIILLIGFSQTLSAQFMPMLNKKKSEIVSICKRNKTLHGFNATTKSDMEYNRGLVNSPFVNEAWYNKTFKPKGVYAFEAHFVHYFDEKNVCYIYRVSMPSGYLPYMMAQLHGYSQIDGTNFRSYNGKTHLEIFLDSDPAVMQFSVEGKRNSPITYIDQGN